MLTKLRGAMPVCRRFHGSDSTHKLKEKISKINKGDLQGIDTSAFSLNNIKEFNDKLTDEEKSKMKRILVYRSNPEDPDNEPHFASYYIDVSNVSMYLDALIKIKSECDSSLTFRRSCREGVCGSGAMNLDGKTTLACINEIDKDLTKASIITPLGHMFVMKDLVVDMTNFYTQYRLISPYLKRKTPKTDETKEYYQSEEDRKKLDGLYECVLCASCSTSCPSYWWKQNEYLGPAVLMQAYRWIIDSRDEFTEERLQQLMFGERVNACENIGMCTATCPKGLDPRKAIQSLLGMIENHKKEKLEHVI